MEWNAALEAMLGYLNFSDGRPSAAFQRALNECYRVCLKEQNSVPWHMMHEALRAKLAALAGTTPAFRESHQAQGVLQACFEHVLPGYRVFHRDLLFSLTDAELFQPFFVARAVEATLAQHGPWDEHPRIVAGALQQLNDFLGHRPVAVLENERIMQPYAKERVRPIPIYLRGVGVGVGRFEAMVTETLAILQVTNPDVLQELGMNYQLLDELALDPRPYDHGHPVNQRPGYLFGEWDPHHLDLQGRFRRFVMRPMILDALLDWVNTNGVVPAAQALTEASAALAGTILLASGISGCAPETHSSEVSLATLVPRVARCRDQFYSDLLTRLPGEHGARLRAEITTYRQPFGRVRQYLNQYLARQRAAQLQNDHLAQAYARMGFAAASERHAQAIPTASLRLRCELQNLLAAAQGNVEAGEVAAASQKLLAAENVLRRAIECGAMVDPWNILGFQGNFAIFPAVENSVLDPRVEQLLECMARIFSLYALALSESAARGEESSRQSLTENLNRLANWWDKFATFEVSDVPRVCGRELAQSALFVMKALNAWREQGAATGDMAFWCGQASGFASPQAYALVVDVLLLRHDLIASCALLMQWLSQAEQSPLEEGQHSFYHLAQRWLREALRRAQEAASFESKKKSSPKASAAKPEKPKGSGNDLLDLVRKFFDKMEVNADHLWQVPSWGNEGIDETFGRTVEERYDTAYEGVSFQDSAADGHEGEVLDGGVPTHDDGLTVAAEHLEERLRFLGNVARLWQMAASAPWRALGPDDWQVLLHGWATQAERNKVALGKLMDALHEFRIAPPLGSHDSLVEFDRLQAVKEEMVTNAIACSVDMAHAVRALMSAAHITSLTTPPDPSAAAVVPPPRSRASGKSKNWEELVMALRHALWMGHIDKARGVLPSLFGTIKPMPLLYVPLHLGGNPRAIFQVRYLRDTLRKLSVELPARGMFRETFHLLKTALRMEKNQPVGGHHQITEFNLLFPVAYKAVIQNLVECLDHWESTRDNDDQAAVYVGNLVARFSRLWIEHLSGVRLSELERRTETNEWDATVDFIRRYGKELFTQKFMTLSNLRGILHQGVAAYLNYLRENPDPHAPESLPADLRRGRLHDSEATEQLEFILRAVVENYDAYKDYNATTTQSDYGENLYMLLELLRVRAGYDRHRWALQPAYIAHRILASKGRHYAAVLLQRAFVEETARIADEYIAQLEDKQKAFGIRLSTISDRIGERLTRPLQLDRMLALVEPAIREARVNNTNEIRNLFEQELEDYARVTTGAGLEVPQWIQQLEDEIDGVLEPVPDSEDDIRPAFPRLRMQLQELQRQLDQWERPI